MNEIQSVQNPTIRRLKALKDKKAREEAHEMLVEGEKLMREAAEEHWPALVHDCCNMTKFARDINLRAREGGWFGATSYACEFDPIPLEIFLPILQDDTFQFLEEEPLPEGYRPGEMVF